MFVSLPTLEVPSMFRMERKFSSEIVTEYNYSWSVLWLALAADHGVAKSWKRLSDLTFTFHFHALEKEMATHSSVRAWRIPGTEEHGGLGSHRVGHDWCDLAAAAVVCNQ